jgi:methylated-DNA-protein-cysteine methyltransferase-like protein
MAVPVLADAQTFNETVWEIVRQVPRGMVTTFGQIASMIPTPDGVDAAEYEAFGGQLVGFAMNAVSGRDEPTVPWHRVINSQGKVAMSESNPMRPVQHERLKGEGLPFSAKGAVDLDLYGWEGPDAAWLAERRLLPPRSIRKNAPPSPPEPDAPQQLTLL